MPKEYPEHIDQLDNFYQQHLVDLEILPPADMWDRISASYAEGSAGKDKPGFIFHNRKKLIGIVAATIFISASTYFYVANSPQPAPEQNSIPVLEKENISDSTVQYLEKEEEEIVNTTTETQNVITPNPSLSEITAVKEEKPTKIKHYDNKTTEDVNEMVVNEPALEAQPEIIVEEITPKQKVSFKDKHKKDYKDSTRSLFVPGK